MIRYGRLSALTSLLILVSIAVVPDAPNNPITFRYNPPDGTGYVLTMRETTEFAQSLSKSKWVDSVTTKVTVCRSPYGSK